MKMILDNRIVKLLVSNADSILNRPLFKEDNHISFRWPSLLEYLGLGSIYLNLPAFDLSHPLFETCISTLCATNDKEHLYNLYDSLFVENLNQISALPQIKIAFLLQAIRHQRQKTTDEYPLLLPVLDMYEKSLTEKSAHTMHDLILYLAWDRMCVCLSRLFDNQSSDPKFIKNINVLVDCLIESFQHITKMGRTKPSFYRMLESLVFYQLRDENLNRHTSAGWTLLTQSIPVLKSQTELVDYFYIDDAVAPDENGNVQSDECYLTLDSQDRVNSRLALAHYIMNQLKAEVPEWYYSLESKKIIHFNSL